LKRQNKEEPIEIGEHTPVFPTEHSKSLSNHKRAELNPRLANLSLTPNDEKLLKNEFGKFLSISPYGNEGLVITTKSYIGVAPFDGFSVVIKPKVLMDPENLFGMINFAFDLEWKNFPEFSPKTDDNFLTNVIIWTFVNQSKLLLKQGLYKSYVTHQDNIPYMRGKLLLKQHLQNVLQNKPKFACEFDKLEYDNIENQIILYCLKQCYNRTDKQFLKKEIRMLIYQLSSLVSDLPSGKYSNVFSRINYTRQNDHYRKVHQTCKLILESTGIVDFYSDQKFLINSFFINMNEIFEKFVFQLFEKVFSDRYWIREQKQKKVWTIDEEKDRSMRTDILLQAKHSDETIVIDTKYKENLSDADLYQIGFYIHEYAKKGIKNIQKVGFAVLPTEKILPETGESVPFSSKTQKIAVVKSYININQIVPLLYDTTPEKQKELHTRIESLLRFDSDLTS